jgi:hypothetical protein
MADDPCKTCQHYDPIKKGKSKEARHGWCSIQSLYPAKEQPGQTFPAGVRRVPPGELAKPLIVTGSEVVSHCMLYRRKA